MVRSRKRLCLTSEISAYFSHGLVQVGRDDTYLQGVKILSVGVGVPPSLLTEYLRVGYAPPQQRAATVLQPEQYRAELGRIRSRAKMP